MKVDERKLNEFVEKAVTDLAAGYGGVMTVLGHKLGLYKAMADAGPLNSSEIAKRSGCAERYVREWLAAQAAAGYIDYDTTARTFQLSPEQAMVFAQADSPVILTGGFYSLQAIYESVPRMAEAFRTGKGLGWGEHCNCLFSGTEKFFGPGYRANLVSTWLPALVLQPQLVE